MSRLRPAPPARYIHPKAVALLDQEGDHDADLDVASESAPNYLSWVADLCRLRLGHRVLEVGAGLGAITARYEQSREVVANDVSPSCVQALRERFADHPNVHVEDRDLRGLEMDARFDSVLMVNVLEHIADDAGALRGLSQLLSLWDRTAVPAARFLEAQIRMPIRLNVLGVGRRLA
jgi:2-polyprenyl-3-methyl-5-hydroxy-6-metoxy-1,4-benzoquinol methylase